MDNSRVRRLITITDDVFAASGRRLSRPKRICVAAAIVENPHAGTFLDDVSSWVAEMSESLGRLLADAAMEPMRGDVEAHGKGVVVGEDGDLELGAALIHTLKFGNRLRERTGATTLLPAVEKLGSTGCLVDIPLRHTQEATTRSHRETYSVQIPHAPRPDEIVVYVAVTDAERPHARIGVYTGDESTS